MPTLTINGQRVTVGDEFLKLSPEEQNSAVDEIAASLPAAGTQTAKPAADNLDWGDVPGQALNNLIPSAKQAGSDLAQPFLHPIDTAKALGQVAGGVAAKAGIGDMDQTAADSVGKFFTDRYGSEEGFKRAVAQDPVGVLSDLGTVMSLGGGAAVRAPGVAGKAASLVAKAGEIVDPVSAAARVGTAVAAPVARAAGRGAAHVLGVTTGVGDAPIRELTRAGSEGNRAALEQLRGAGNSQDIVDDARAAFGEIRDDRGAQYVQDMNHVFSDTQPLALTDVTRQIANERAKVYPTGKIANDAEAASTLDQINSVVNEANQLGDLTPRGLDSLKRRIDAIGQSAGGSFSKGIANRISGSLIDTVSTRHPDYRTGLLGYTNRSRDLTQIEKELSVHNANDNTTLRKLLSSQRNNVNTNFGRRGELVNDLAAKRPNLPGQIAGASMSSAMPTGLARILGPGSAAAAAYYAANPWALAALPAASPRLMGEAAYKVGQAAGALSPTQTRILGRTSYQAGRASDEAKKKKGSK
ncbi:hypothetical protein [Rhizobium favelukesii]|uniref:Conserved protein n=1 Tax=Rhizobium favelukesii TaxID=348824 RepID=W6R7U8_9HYPH|nr:hypothetical protein [Rhizobium favelukesii]MCS0459334.1 hypothetical protein [Rhizobium favelukesii]CDM57367.1 putative conserved protein [Rhizobium favelukesii]